MSKVNFSKMSKEELVAYLERQQKIAALGDIGITKQRDGKAYIWFKASKATSGYMDKMVLSPENLVMLLTDKDVQQYILDQFAQAPART